MTRRSDPDWSQPIRFIADAVTGRHTRAGQGKKAGCLDAIVFGTGVIVLIGQAVTEWL